VSDNFFPFCLIIRQWTGTVTYFSFTSVMTKKTFIMLTLAGNVMKLFVPKIQTKLECKYIVVKLVTKY
jgi:hypothetical protein